MSNLTNLVARVLGELVGSLAERAVDALTARRPTDPAPPPPAPRLRPVRKPRDHHVWESYDDDGRPRVPPRCVNCDVDRTAANSFAACPGRPVARFY